MTPGGSPLVAGAVVVAFAIGLVLPLQAGVNSQLRVALGHPLLAAVVSFTVGTAVLIMTVLFTGVSLPAAGAVGATRWWQWTGGVLGATFVCMTIILAPRLGAATLIALVVAGQMVSSLVLDHYGLVGYPQHSLNPWRILGALLILAGVALIQRH
ncbi:MAG TPA: DMT family transporter [Gemmatimonadales bacterium]|nr:DMT family transporter [Gemmatimonadales bacterium]